MMGLCRCIFHVVGLAFLSIKGGAKILLEEMANGMLAGFALRRLRTSNNRLDADGPEDVEDVKSVSEEMEVKHAGIGREGREGFFKPHALDAGAEQHRLDQSLGSLLGSAIASQRQSLVEVTIGSNGISCPNLCETFEIITENGGLPF